MTAYSFTLPWPPAYKIKKHRLAKHVKLKMYKDRGLEITTPVRFNEKKIPAILEENKQWIIQHLSSPQKKCEALPVSIALHALNEIWTIHYVNCESTLEMIVRPCREIVLVGKIGNHQACKDKLIDWVKDQSRKYLASELALLSQQMKMDFEHLTIRDQKTRWGSCTVNKSISLNYKLVFLPPHLSQHVIIHELCHTVYLNHSHQFWNKVAEFDPAWRMHKQELRKANQYVPEWI